LHLRGRPVRLDDCTLARVESFSRRLAAHRLNE
jgi:hypothetical protein